MKVVLTERAQARLVEIHAHIAGDDPAAAERVVLRILQVIEMLGDFPKLGPEWNAETRAIVVSGLPYRVHYRIADDRVEILTVLHTRQAPPSQL